MGLRAREQEETVPAIAWIPREELARRPVDVAIPIRHQAHLGPFLGEDEEILGVDPGHPRGREVADQVAQSARGRPAGIDPSAERHDQSGQVPRQFAVELYILHAHPLGRAERPSPVTLGRLSRARRLDAGYASRSLGFSTCASRRSTSQKLGFVAKAVSCNSCVQQDLS
jgi:hypothetical protein